MAEILYQGHSSFRIKTKKGLVFYIDPFKGDGYDLYADVILITHDHFDHCNIEIVPQKKDCTVIGPKQAMTDGQYNTFEINDIRIEAVPAYNKFHSKDECVGYIMELEGRKIYFTGDTGITDEMSSYPEKNLDLIFVPCDGIYTMDLEEAKLCTQIVKAKFCVPVHMVPQSGGEAPLFDYEKAKAFGGTEKIIVKPGENIFL